MLWQNSFEKTFKKAGKCIENDNLVEAKNLYLKCLSMEPDNIIVLNNLAQLYGVLGDEKNAKGYSEILLNECNKKLDNNSNENLLLIKTSALISLKRYDELNYTLDELLKLNPENEYGLTQKIKYLELNKQHEKAIHYIDKLLTDYPNNISLFLAKGRNLVELNEFGEAEKCYDLALMMETKNKAAINLKSELLKKKHNINLTPHDLMLKAVESFEREDFKASKEYYKKALDMNPEYDEIWFAQGELFIRTGYIGKAIASFKKAFSINPNSGGIVDHDGFFKMLNRMKKINMILGFEESEKMD